YLSSIPYGENTVGLRSAAKHYFLKDESRLSADESLSLAMTILDPEQYNPHRTLTISELTRRAVIKARANKSRKRIEKHVEDILSELLDKGGI
ncbi:MAG: transglycosylase domain-containing protein, partial [Bdellovibrionales bacterium]|nr:transglycosylase domain-containing protein [Bdellovibrionales bacterium]